MKITEVKAVYPNYKNVAASWRTHFWQIVVRIETDQGITGLGYGGGGVAAVEVINGHFRELLLGTEINNIQENTFTMIFQLFNTAPPIYCMDCSKIDHWLKGFF